MKKILVVEDDKLCVGLIKEIFIRKGYNFEITDNPMKAILKIANMHYDLVILDYSLVNFKGDCIEPILMRMRIPAFYYTGYLKTEINTNLPVITKNGDLSALVKKVEDMLGYRKVEIESTRPTEYHGQMAIAL